MCTLLQACVEHLTTNMKWFQLVAKDVIRSVMGWLSYEVAFDVPITDIGQLPPSLMMDAAKQ